MENKVNREVVRVYKYRWIILLLFCLYSSINFLQFLQYSIIANITGKYYDVDSTLVDLAGLIFMICFIIFIIPVNYLIEKYNLRVTAILSSGLTTCGNLIKLLSISRDRYYVVLIGQFLCAVAQVFMLSIPSKLASTWFGSEEVSTACAIAILGTQIGVALGCVFPSNLVKNSNDMDKIGKDFWLLNIINASVTSSIFILVLLCNFWTNIGSYWLVFCLVFRAKPATPPSQSQINLFGEEKRISIWQYIKALFRNKNYLLILLAFGSSNGMYSCFGIVVNQIYLHYFEGYESEIGIISAMAVVAGGCIGSVVFGYVLDKWHHFKITSFFIIIGSSVTYIFVALSMELKSQLATYFTIPIFGFFVASTLLVGFEFATEVMYPVPEAASCGILNTFIYLFSIMYTLGSDALLDSVGYTTTHVIIVIVLALSSIAVFFMRPTLNRREANIANREN